MNEGSGIRMALGIPQTVETMEYNFKIFEENLLLLFKCEGRIKRHSQMCSPKIYFPCAFFKEPPRGCAHKIKGIVNQEKSKTWRLRKVGSAHEKVKGNSK